MVQITRGTGVTLKSRTLEQRLIEAFYLLQSNLPEDTSASVGFDIDLENSSITVTYRLPAIYILNSEGGVVISGIPLLNNFNFAFGEGSQFLSTFLNGQLVEMLFFAQSLEGVQTLGTNLVNRISANYSSDDQLLTGTVVLDVAITQDSNDGYLKLLTNEFLN